MTTLDLLTLVCLTSQSVREQLAPQDFEPPLRASIERMQRGQADAVAELRAALKAECGVEWDGVEKVSVAVLNEARRLAGIAKAERAIDGKIEALRQAKTAIRCPVIAGRDAVDAAVKTVKES